MNSTALEEALKRPISAPTGRKPGYGVKPLVNDSQAEKQRFKRDYFNAMRDKFGSDELALQAFIQGPGRLSRRLKQDAGTHAPDLYQSSQNEVSKPLLSETLNSIGFTKKHEPHNLSKPAVNGEKAHTMARDWTASSHVMPSQNGEWEASSHVIDSPAKGYKPVSEMSEIEKFLTGIGGKVGIGSLNLMENIGAESLIDTAAEKLFSKKNGLSNAKAQTKNLLNELGKTDSGSAGETIGSLVPYMIGQNTLSQAIQNGGLAALTKENPTQESALKEVLTSTLGYGAGKLVGGVFTPRPEIRKLMRENDVVPSVGQALGGKAETIEKFMGKGMLFEDAVRAARNRGFKELGSAYRETLPDEYSLLAKILGIKAAMHPYLSIPMYLAGQLGSERPVQKALLGGYKGQKALGQVHKGLVINAINKDEKK